MKKKTKNLIYGGLFIIALAIILYFTGVIRPQSVIAPMTTLKVESGKPYWVGTYSVDSIKEGQAFMYSPANMPTYTSSDGSTITPKNSEIIYFSRGANYCKYKMTNQQRSYWYVLGTKTINYYVLSNPERIINIDVCSSGGCGNYDATLPFSYDLKDSDGKGTVKMTTVGAFMGKYDCPNYQGVVLIYGSNNVLYFKQKSDFDSKANDVNLFNGLVDVAINGNDYMISKTYDDIVFPNDFTSILKADLGRTYLQGDRNDLGTGVITLTADADFFESTYYIPPQQAKPDVQSFTCSDVKQDGTGTFKVTITNSGQQGTVLVSGTATRASISPASQTIILGTTQDLYYTYKAYSTSGSNIMTIKACSSGQFSSTYCSEKSCTNNILQEQPQKYCGDKTCSPEIGENSNTCIGDCPLNSTPQPDPTPLYCPDKLGGLITGYPTQIEKCGLFSSCWFGLSEPTLVNTCDYDYSLIWIIGAILLALVIILIIASKFGGKKHGGRRK